MDKICHFQYYMIHNNFKNVMQRVKKKTKKRSLKKKDFKGFREIKYSYVNKDTAPFMIQNIK